MPHPSLFFTNQSAYGFASDNYWSTMVRDICGALGRSGLPCDLVEPKSSQEFQAFLATSVSQQRQFIASLNFVMPFADMSIGDTKIFVQELYPVRAVTLFLDHPVHLASAIVQFENGARSHSFRPARAPLPLYGVMEADHATLLHDLGIEPNRIFVFPQAGPRSTDESPLFSQRPIDLLFHGSIADPVSDEDFFRQGGFLGTDIRNAASECIQAVLSGSEDVYGAAKRVLANLGKDGDVLNVAAFARSVSARIRALRRWNLLCGLADLQVTYCGKIGERFKAANANGIYLGPKSFADVMHLARQSKIVLNDTINLRQAALVRFHYSMAQGCVLATESSDWFRSAYADGTNAILLERGDAHADRLRAVLADPKKGQAIADAGRALQAAAHQWDHRVEPMIRALNTN